MELNYWRLKIILLCLLYPVLLISPRNFGHEDPRPQLLTEFFEARNCPAINFVPDFILYADIHKIDWRLLPAISILESSGGKNYPKETNNIFGWANCLVKFHSIPSSIDYIAGRLANSHYYKGKTVKEILEVYNPYKTYHNKALKLMRELGKD